MAPRRSLEKLSRRAGVELGLKGARQVAGKSGRTRRPFPPGQQGRAGQQGRRRKRDSEYLTQLREKQKIQWFYGVAAGQLQRYFDASRRRPEATGEELLRQLEERLDNVVYRLGFSGTRAQARQFVTHGHVQVNGQRVDRPSYEVRPGDIISIESPTGWRPISRRSTGECRTGRSAPKSMSRPTRIAPSSTSRSSNQLGRSTGLA